MLKKPFTFLAMITILAVVARAADEAPGGDPPAHVGFMKGFILKVEADSLTFKDKAGPEVKVATNDSTKVTIDGKPAVLADLKEGYFVQVTSANDTAEKIIASIRKGKQAK